MNMEIKSIPTTKNEGWGFWGTLSGSDRDVTIEWAAAIIWIKETGAAVDGKLVTDDEIRGFLDSRMGRHIADQMIGNGLTFKEALVQVGRFTSATQALYKGYDFAGTIREFRVNPW
jgi:hypothetical protein